MSDAETKAKQAVNVREVLTDEDRSQPAEPALPRGDQLFADAIVKESTGVLTFPRLSRLLRRNRREPSASA
jgi:hypothetical protein